MTSLSDVTEFIVDSEHKTAPIAMKGYPYIRTPNIGRGYLILDNVRLVSEKSYREWTKRAIPQKDDLILAREAPVGNVAIIPENLKLCLGQRTVLIRPNEVLINSRYLMFLLLGDEIQHKFQAYSSGATVPHLNLSDIRNLDLPELPSREIQDKIASFLGAFDDLVEVNLRRIRVLEELARSLYNEWFVRLRFPGHEDTEITQTEHGPTPEGWAVKTASESMIIDPKIRVKRDTLKKFVPMSSLSTTSMIVEDFENRKSSSGSKFQNDDTLFARITPSLENGKTGYVQFLDENEVGIGSTEFIVLRSKILTPEFVYLMARSESFRNNAIKSMIGASGRQRVQKECFNNYYFPHPPKEILDSFSKIVRPFFNQIYVLAKQNRNLKETRDLLLPSLISGEIDISDIDIAV